MASLRKRSRTRSAANLAQRDTARLASLTFFVDRQLGRFIVPEALRAAGAQVEAHDDHFAQNTPDVEWLTKVGKWGWVVISKDQNIRRNPLELTAYEAAKVRGYFVTAAGASGPENAALLARCLPGMVRRSAGRSGPFLFSISRSTVFTKLF